MFGWVHPAVERHQCDSKGIKRSAVDSAGAKVKACISSSTYVFRKSRHKHQLCINQQDAPARGLAHALGPKH
eukprot:scaffold259561_cov19-Tisochrysis_lutea.AAC.1